MLVVHFLFHTSREGASHRCGSFTWTSDLFLCTNPGPDFLVHSSLFVTYLRLYISYTARNFSHNSCDRQISEIFNLKLNRLISTHQQNRSPAVALGANLRLLIVFRKLLWGCVAGSSPGVLGRWGAGRGCYLVLWYCRYLVTSNLKLESGM